MSREDLNNSIRLGAVNSKAFTVHAAYKLQSGQHITIFYNDRCDLSTFVEMSQFLSELPVGRCAEARELVELYNPKDPDDPLIGVKLEILTEDITFTDKALMARIAEFSDKYSWRQHLEDTGAKQFTFNMHATLGLKSEQDMDKLEHELPTWVFYIEKKYFKLHCTGEKFFID